MGKRVFWLCLVVLGGFVYLAPQILAQGASSNYKIDESFIGPGGNLESGSSNYSLENGQQSVGNAGGVGESTSSNYTTQSGATTTPDPRLACVLNSGSLNFGGLSYSSTVSGTASFSVLNYTAYGYNVSLIGPAPSNGTHNLDNMTTTGPSVIGTEQFGVNLRANTTPSIGSDPVQVPSGTFSFGTPTTNYNTPNNFRYIPGENIATSVRSSGQTDYTVSYIINTSTTTPGGRYTGNQAVLCTGTY